MPTTKRFNVDLSSFNAQIAEELRTAPAAHPLVLPAGLDGSVENIKRLHQLHVRRYLTMKERAERGDPGYRLHELKELLVAWRAVEEAGYVFDKMPPRAQQEVFDALMDEAG